MTAPIPYCTGQITPRIFYPIPQLQPQYKWDADEPERRQKIAIMTMRLLETNSYTERLKEWL